MRKIILLIALLTFIASHTDAQRWKLKRYRIILGAGTSNYFGDIGGAADENNWFGIKDLELEYTNPMYHIGFLYKYTERWDFKIGFNYAQLMGNDAGSLNERRGLSFKTTVFEPNIQANYIFYSQGRTTNSRNIFNKRGMLNRYSKINLYGFVSLGCAFFKPTVSPQSVIDRRSDEFSLDNQFSIVAPLGIGFFYIHNSYLEFGIEIGPRIVLSDYIDGFNSDWSKFYDIYYLTMFSVRYKVETSREGYPVFNLFNKY